MLQGVFSVFDSKAAAYLPPFYAPTAGSALRSFMDAISKADHPFGKYPEDYTLFELGSFDDSTGKFDCLSTPVSRGTAIELVSTSA